MNCIGLLGRTSHGPEIKKAFKERLAIQIADYKQDPLTERLVPILNHYKNELQGSILDVGCYAGFVYHWLGKPTGYKGIDIWPEAIEAAKEAFPSGDFEVANLMDFDGHFDVVWSSQIIWKHSKIEPSDALTKLKSLGKKIILITTIEEAFVLGDESDDFGKLRGKVFDLNCMNGDVQW